MLFGGPTWRAAPMLARLVGPLVLWQLLAMVLNDNVARPSVTQTVVVLQSCPDLPFRADCAQAVRCDSSRGWPAAES